MSKFDNKLKELSELEENWDSYGALPISKDVIQFVGRIMDLLEAEPFICPLNDGGIQIEWELGDRFIELEISPNFKNASTPKVELIHNLLEDL
jgi:hypothetical protein